jgi:hypothetical protein
MDERAEIWIARDPETNAESKAVSLRKLRKGVRIGRLQESTLVKRVDATEWVTLERLLADAEVMSRTPPPVQAITSARDVPAREPPRPAPRVAPLPAVVVSASVAPPPMGPSPEATDEITEVEEVERAAAAQDDATVPGKNRPPIAALDGASATGGQETGEETGQETGDAFGDATDPTSADSSADRLAFHRAPSLPADDETALTTQWFTQSLIPPEPDDDEPIFPERTLLDVNFEHVMTTRFVKLAYVLLIASLSLAILASIIRAGAAVVGGDTTQAATAVALVPVVVLGCAVVGAFGRMTLEVLLAVFRIADRLTALSKSVSRST